MWMVGDGWQLWYCENCFGASVTNSASCENTRDLVELDPQSNEWVCTFFLSFRNRQVLYGGLSLLYIVFLNICLLFH